MTFFLILAGIILFGAFAFVAGAMVFSAISGYVLMIYGIIMHIIRPIIKLFCCILKPIFRH